MDWNSLIFPIPKASYTKLTFPNQLIWVPKKEYNYKDKLKYKQNLPQYNNNNHINNHNHNYKHNIQKLIKTKTPKKQTNKIIFHSKSTSMIQRVPSISFQIDNKFLNDSLTKPGSSLNTTYIPCLFLKSSTPTDKLLIYFHSNYEDLGNTYSFCKKISTSLNMNVLAVEYPNYGLYKSTPSSPLNADTINNDAEVIFKFINEVENIKESNIIIMGRCVGSGPATYLATKHSVMALILLSPFKSIKEAIKTMFPRLNVGTLLKSLVKERFNNYESISKVVSPILFIHGKEDNVIPPIHSVDLIEKCKAPAKMVIPDTMTHSVFDFEKDVIVHIRDFFKVFGIVEEGVVEEDDEGMDDMDEGVGVDVVKEIDFPKWMFKAPC